MKIHLFLAVALIALTTTGTLRSGEGPAAEPPGNSPPPLVTGWSMLKEGKAERTAEVDAKHPTNTDPHLLKIAITKYPEFGQGRLGLKNATPIAVQEGRSYDITFNGISEGIGVGLVFSLETDDGKVLARTTLPEIGRGARGGRGGRGATPSSDSTNAATSQAVSPAPVPPWRSYRLSVKAMASSPNAHLIVTAIEPVPVWIENVALVERAPSK